MSGNSSDRRKERRAEHRKMQRDLVLWYLAAAMALILWLLPNRTVPATVAGLVLPACFLIVPVLHLPMIRKAQPGSANNLSRAIGVVSVVGVVAVLGMDVWPVAGLGELSSHQQEEFLTKLKSQPEPILIHLMCPPNDERDCAVAGQFIALFRKVGWKVKGNIVDRVFNGSPKAGFYLVLHSTVDPDPGNPEGKTGAWTKMPPAYFTVKSAFDMLVKTDMVVGARVLAQEILR